MKRRGFNTPAVLAWAFVAGVMGCSRASPPTTLSPMADHDPDRYQRALAEDQAHKQALAEAEAKWFRGRAPDLPE
jgi:hypothetical protein